MSSPAEWFVGTSGWSYKHWKGVFYPDGLKAKEWFSFYASVFSTVEVNSTFYHMPRDSTVDGWREKSPDHFVFTLKMNRWITHRKKLEGVDFLLRQFLDTARHLEHKLGVILHQLPPSLKRDIPLLASYLKLLPKGMKHAVEFRHESWSHNDTFDLLRSEDVAYCIVSAPDLKTYPLATAPFAYIRMHGKGGWYASCYSDDDLRGWSQEIAKLAKAGCDGYVYFNNDYAGYAVQNAVTIRKQLDHPSRRHILSVV